MDPALAVGEVDLRRTALFGERREIGQPHQLAVRRGEKVADKPTAFSAGPKTTGTTWLSDRPTFHPPRRSRSRIVAASARTSLERLCEEIVSAHDYDLHIALESGSDGVIEFTPTQTGFIKFSCSMGMYTGTHHNRNNGAIYYIISKCHRDFFLSKFLTRKVLFHQFFAGFSHCIQ